MNIRNYEFKARVDTLEPYETKLQKQNPAYGGLDHQVDTYFNVPVGRLKLREGNIENALICYQRIDNATSKLSEVILYKHQPDAALKQILTLQFGIKAVVDKKRKIYFINNIKFHFDEVAGLGFFIEVEAIDTNHTFTTPQLKEQCDHYATFFNLEPNQFEARSYSDMILAKISTPA